MAVDSTFQSLAPWLLALTVLVLAYPWASWLLASDCHSCADLPALAALTLALSEGTLSLVMLWEGLLGIRFEAAGVTLPYILLMLPGVVLWKRQRHTIRNTRCANAVDFPGGLLAIIALLALVLISISILFNAVYWPFSRADAIGIYGDFATRMYTTRALVPVTPNSEYQTYPMLLPFIYSYAYLISGWEHEYIARFFSTMLSLGVILATYSLAAAMYDRRTAWLSVLLLALTPTYASWASAGYADLPMAFFYTLTSFFAWRLCQTGHWSNALLTGITMGLTAWTKNAALVGCAVLSVWLLWAWFQRKIAWTMIMLSVSAFAAVAAPWYVRNLVQAGFLIPNTAWVQQAQPTLANLLALVTYPQNFGLSGWIMLVGIGAALTELIRRKEEQPQNLLLLWILPYFVIWWLFLSYDPRFILYVLSPLSILGAISLSLAWVRIRPPIRKYVLGVGGLLLLVLVLQTIWISIEFKREILRNPGMNHETKQSIVLGHASDPS